MLTHKPIYTKEELDNEIWKPVHEHYEASNLGRVRYINILDGNFSDTYQRISFASGKHGRNPQTKMVHTLIAQAFLGERPTDLVINHKDLNKWNNRATNLEYITQAENNLHARLNRPYWDTTQTGKNSPKGKMVNTAKLTESDVKEIRSLYSTGVSNKTLRHKFNISKSQVSKIVLRQSWKQVD